VRLREELGLLTRPADEELAHDRAEQAAWLAELRSAGLLGDDPSVEQVISALYAYLGRTPSRLLALALPDAVGDVRTQNQPGTINEYPNWRVKLTDPDGREMLLEDVFADPRAGALAEVMRTQVTPARD
jgi:4-alpha-glucanotransferase